MLDILPDSRAKVARGHVFAKSGTWVPVFCANCGKDGGLCPEESTFMFYLCDQCFETHGEIAGTMTVPDAMFYQRLAQEQQEVHGRALSHMELLQVVEEDDSPLAKLLKEAK